MSNRGLVTSAGKGHRGQIDGAVGGGIRSSNQRGAHLHPSIHQDPRREELPFSPPAGSQELTKPDDGGEGVLNATTKPAKKGLQSILSGTLTKFDRFDDDFLGMAGIPVTEGPSIEVDVFGKPIATGTSTTSKTATSSKGTVATVGASSMLVKALAGGGARHGVGGTIKIEGSPALWQLLINHLRHLGTKGTAAANALRQEMQERDVSISFYSPLASPVDLGDRLDANAMLGQDPFGDGGLGGTGFGNIVVKGLSPLSRILYPQAFTRAAIQTLLFDINLTQQSLCRGDGASFQMAAYLAMAEESMWSEAPDTAAKTLFFHPTSGKLRAASLNQLVEMMTPAYLTPHQSISRESELDQERFCVDVFLTHRMFTTSHVLLAKLLQRYFVPLDLPFSETFNRHNLVVDIRSAKDIPGVPLALDFPSHLAPLVRGRSGSGGGGDGGGDFASLLTPETRIWIAATRLVNIRVATVIALWAREFPEHFDLAMCDAVETWIDECCMGGVGCVWSNSPSELYCCAEAIMQSLSTRVEELEFYKSLSRGKSKPGQVVGAGGPVGFALHSPLCTMAPTLRPTSFMGANRSSIELQSSDDLPIRLPVTIRNRDAFSNSNVPSPPTSRFRPRSAAGRGDVAAGANPTSVGSLSGQSTESLRIQLGEFLEINSHVAATQLTCVDRILIRRVTSEELFVLCTSDVPGLRDRTSSVGSSSPSALSQLLSRFEALMSWVLDRLLDAVQLDNRNRHSTSQMWPETQEALQHAVTLAFRLVQCNNFHSGFAVVSALLHPSFATVYRHVLFPVVHKNLKASVEELAQLFDFSRGGTKFRAFVDGLKDADAMPVIPVLQLMAEEMRQMETTQETILMDSSMLPTIHWRKMRVIATILRKLRTARTATAGISAGLDLEVYEWFEMRLAGPFRGADDMSRIAADAIRSRLQ